MLISRLPLIVTLLLIVMIGAALYVQITPFIASSESSVNASPLTASRPSQPSPEPEKSYNIASFKLFGDATQQPDKPQVIEENLPETSLRLTLTGVQAGQIENQNGALIEGPDRSTNYYKVGDALPGNATLQRVFPDRVVIQRSGKLENLYFPEAFSNSRLLTSNAPEPSIEIGNTNYQTAPQVKRQIDTIDDARKQSIKDRLSRLRQRINNSN